MVVAAERVAAFSFVRRPSHPALVFGSLKLMSALGQKQTCAVHKPMSALCQKRTSHRVGEQAGGMSGSRKIAWLRSQGYAK